MIGRQNHRARAGRAAWLRWNRSRCRRRRAGRRHRSRLGRRAGQRSRHAGNAIGGARQRQGPRHSGRHARSRTRHGGRRRKGHRPSASTRFAYWRSAVSPMRARCLTALLSNHNRKTCNRRRWARWRSSPTRRSPRHLSKPGPAEPAPAGRGHRSHFLARRLAGHVARKPRKKARSRWPISIRLGCSAGEPSRRRDSQARAKPLLAKVKLGRRQDVVDAYRGALTRRRRSLARPAGVSKDLRRLPSPGRRRPRDWPQPGQLSQSGRRGHPGQRARSESRSESAVSSTTCWSPRRPLDDRHRSPPKRPTASRSAGPRTSPTPCRAQRHRGAALQRPVDHARGLGKSKSTRRPWPICWRICSHAL